MQLLPMAWNIVLYSVPFLAVLMAIVFVHELGHFLAARWCGIRVSAFSLGFGRELCAFTDRYGTRWRLAAIPLGGYVNFARPAPSATDGAASAGAQAETVAVGEGELRTAPLRHRALIVAAGPLANFVFTFVLFVVLGVSAGVRDLAPRIGYVDAASPAAEAGLAAGDVVTAMAGAPVFAWNDIERLLAEGGDRPLTVSVDRGGRHIDVAVTPRMIDRDAGLGRTVKVPSIGIDSDLPPVIGRVTLGQPAAIAGLQPGDRVLAVDGEPITSSPPLVAQPSPNPARPLALTIERNQARLELSATPQRSTRHGADGQMQVIGRLGVTVEPPPSHRLGFGRALVYGARETGHAITQTLAVMGSIFTSREAAEQVGGPLLMAEATAEVVKLGAATLVVWMAILSANLGLFNLLPIPVLDGGHLMFYALEAIRRRPLSPRTEAMGLKLGLAVIGTMVVLVNLSDLFRLGKRLLG